MDVNNNIVDKGLSTLSALALIVMGFFAVLLDPILLSLGILFLSAFIADTMKIPAMPTMTVVIIVYFVYCVLRSAILKELNHHGR